jgi:hypothetical protein
VNETIDLRTPEENARLRHFLRSALNQIVGYADVVWRYAKEQGARAEAACMEQAAAAGREGIEIMQVLLPVNSHLAESALPMLRTNLRTRVERIAKAVEAFESVAGDACADEVGKIRLALADLTEFVREPVRPSPTFELPESGDDGQRLPGGRDRRHRPRPDRT